MTWIISTQYGTGLAKNLRDVVFKRRYQDGHQLADRIWNLAAISEREILGRVNAAISQGISAIDLSRSVRDFLLKPGPAWTTGIKPSVTGRGSLAYNALRLARTEINQGYRQAHKLQAMNSPLVVGIKWNLSASHPTSWPASAEYMGYPEICDYYAKHDHSGLGPGVFPKDNVPDDHPQGMCFNTDQLAPPEQLESLLIAHSEMEAGLIPSEQVDELSRKAAITANKSQITALPSAKGISGSAKKVEPIVAKKFSDGHSVDSYFRNDKEYKIWAAEVDSDDHIAIQEYSSNIYKQINSYNRKTDNWGPDGAHGSIIQEAEEFMKNPPNIEPQRPGESFFAYKRRRDAAIPLEYRTAVSSKETAIKNNEVLDRLISKSELKDDIVTYRAVTVDAFPSHNELSDLIGKPYTDPSFMSTTPTLSSAAINKEYVMEIVVPRGKNRGIYLEDFTAVKNEHELLLPRNSRFSITGIRTEGSRTFIEMEMLP